jgi:hypothetical protein
MRRLPLACVLTDEVEDLFVDSWLPLPESSDMLWLCTVLLDVHSQCQLIILSI